MPHFPRLNRTLTSAHLLLSEYRNGIKHRRQSEETPNYENDARKSTDFHDPLHARSLDFAHLLETATVRR